MDVKGFGQTDLQPGDTSVYYTGDTFGTTQYFGAPPPGTALVLPPPMPTSIPTPTPTQTNLAALKQWLPLALVVVAAIFLLRGK